MSIVFITGTDTGVGKTVASLLALHVLTSKRALYLKPVQTGCTDPNHDSDAAFIAAHLPGGLPQGMTPAQATGICRAAPKAPLWSGAPINPKDLTNFVKGHTSPPLVTIVEGAGGILVPITPHWTMLDLAQELQAAVLVIGRAGLGTINHTALTLRAIKNTGLTCLGAVLMDAQDLVPEKECLENKTAITQLTGCPVWGTIGRLNLHAPTTSALAIMHAALTPILAQMSQDQIPGQSGQSELVANLPTSSGGA